MVLLLCVASLLAAPEGLFEAGGLEFGGEMSAYYTPDYYIFDSEDRDANRGNYFFMLNGTGSFGYFPIDRLSLQLMPGIFYTRSVDDKGDDVDQYVMYLLEVGTDYYMTGSYPWVFSGGLDLGLGVSPGLDGKYNGEDDPDESLELLYVVEPKISGYYFVSERIAPYISISSFFINSRRIRGYDGSSYTESRDFMESWRLNMQFKIGMKYFFPAGARQLDKKNILGEFPMGD
jgi:hypothetical protein